MCKHEFLSIKPSVASQFYAEYFQILFWVFVELENVIVTLLQKTLHISSKCFIVFDIASRTSSFKKCAFEGQATKSRCSELDVWRDRRYSRLRDKSGLVSGLISGWRSIGGSRGHRRVRGRLQVRTDLAGRSAVHRQRFPAQSKISKTTLCLLDVASWEELGAIRKCVYHAKGRRFGSVKVERNDIDFAIYFGRKRLETFICVARNIEEKIQKVVIHFTQFWTDSEH